MTAIHRTPFHVRTAAHNPTNAWSLRGGFTVPAHYGDPLQETLAARMSAVMIDATAQAELRFSGDGAAELLGTAFRADMESLLIGRSEQVSWCADGGGVRGLGSVYRLGATDFLLRSVDGDLGWFAAVAPRFDAQVREATFERGALAIAGPFASAVLAAAELEDASRLEPGQHAIYDWQQFGVIVFHGPAGHYEISCAPEDAVPAFDRMFEAGRSLSVRLAGQEALDLLQLEAGTVLPHVDFAPARDASAREPQPATLGLAKIGHDGRIRGKVLAGIVFDSDEPAPFTPVVGEEGEAGHTLRSQYSPALRRAIALALLVPAYGAGRTVAVRSTTERGTSDVKGRVVALPFL